MGICKKCGTDGTLIAGICTECINIEAYERSKEDYLEDPYWTPGPTEAGLLEVVDDCANVRMMSNMANLVQESTVRILMGLKQKDKEDDEAIKKIMVNMGLFNASDRVTYRSSIEKMYSKYQKMVDNGKYKIGRARMIKMADVNVIDTCKGVIVYTDK